MSNDNDVVVPDPASPDDPAREGSTAVRPRRPRRPWWLVVVPVLLAVLLVAGLVVGVVSFAHWRTDQQAQADRQDAVTAAEQFTLRLDALDYKDLGQYEARVGQLLTTKMKTDFKQNYASFAPVFKAIEITSKGEVRAAGVQDIDDDSATVLVIHDVDVTSKGCVQPPYKRMKVELQKVQGRWLVSDFTEDVPGCQG